MNTQDSTIKLRLGCIYSLNDNTNYTLKQFTQTEVTLKYIEEMKVKERKISMEQFLNSNPQNRGEI